MELYIMKIKSNTTNKDLYLDVSVSIRWQEPEEELVSFSSDEGL